MGTRQSAVGVPRALAALALVFGSCHTPYDPQRVPLQADPTPIATPIAEPPAPKPPPLAPNQDIVVCGRRVAIGAPVVLWTEDPFYDASQTGPRFSQAKDGVPPKLRYQPGRVRRVPNPAFVEAPKAGEPDTRTAEQREELIVGEVLVGPDEMDPAALRDVIDQFVLHFDVCGISRNCFRVLQDVRNLSVHFMLDVDGTIYQTLDLRDTAWHAKHSNTRSIGVEIAQIGAYSARESWRLDPWYEEVEAGTRLSFPSWIKETGIRTKDFVGRTARPRRLQGTIQGQSLHQYDFTPEQYESLVKLAAALSREFPKIAIDAPRDAGGAVVDHVLDNESWRSFHGILGHYHVQEDKIDPGPAFDWEPFLERVREQFKVQLPRTD